MGDVLDRWRLNQGFNPYDNETQTLAIQSWVHVLDRKGIPASAYNELYERSLEARAIAIQSGRELPRMGAELLIAHWLGENGLSKERRDLSRAILPEHREKVCGRCYGSNEVAIGEDRGQPCDHSEKAAVPMTAKLKPIGRALPETEEEILMRCVHAVTDKVGREKLLGALVYVRAARYGKLEELTGKEIKNEVNYEDIPF